MRWEFGNAPSLYKLYFTSDMRDYRETTEESTSMKFAKEFLPSRRQGALDGAESSRQPTPATAAPAAEAPRKTLGHLADLLAAQ